MGLKGENTAAAFELLYEDDVESEMETVFAPPQVLHFDYAHWN